MELCDLPDERTGLEKEWLKRAFLDNLLYGQGKFPTLATKNDYYMALAYTVRDRMLQRWISTAETYTRLGSRTVAYLSAEFLLGPHLGNNLVNLGIEDSARQAMRELGISYEELLGQEEEPGLGNGGLGRLAACFLDSLATLEIPALGYGIRYEFGIFAQDIVDGQQVELTDKWLRYGNPWELPRPEWAVEVRLGGHTQRYTDDKGRTRHQWHPAWTVIGTPYDTPILGYRNHTANTLRLWRAEAPESFDLSTFNRGDYWGAVNKKVVSENITKVLYPNDEQIQGKELRLQQQYFFVSCSLQDMLRIMEVQQIPVERFHEKFAVQLNDTHPAVAIAELMRLLVDERGMEWAEAWAVTRRTFAYTNHTLLPEALEQWPITLFARILPRHLEIIYEINAHHLDEVRIRFLGEHERLSRLSLINEHGERYVRMAHLACVGSHAINGVAALHTDLLKADVLADFHALSPEKFSNKTNGVTPRRWIVLANPRLSGLICKAIGDDWIRDLDQLRGLEGHADDTAFRSDWRYIKRAVKEDFAGFLRRRLGTVVDPQSLFDVQVKRIHEYKRQHLSVLHIVALYHRIKSDPNLEITPRTFIFGGKAAPGYHMAKLMIRLINAVGDVVNRDPVVRDRLKVVYVPNFNVSNGQRIYPAAELSEQISTAGKEASGTGNMKFMMNGALTIGTLDGANIEIREEAGAENFFLFGLTAAEVQEIKASGYRPMDCYHNNPELKAVLDLIREGCFSRGDREVFRPLVDNLLFHDPYMLLADFRSYVDCQARVGEAYRDKERWTRMSILNVARSGKFSSDRTIREYCEAIWRVKPVQIGLLGRREFLGGMGQ
ncbi:MAG TPA: glycogen/starch/alpha-glucan phosphorylase [Thiobacillaceae bacterium]|nr:glycogen/starch/alpha-glucan phosphorylase [Thiobacillaceae bacterium]HNF88327.1 glycogen/starch/alpha-glucan phosphorylase [Thiobacillaceae bacterium]HNH88141.1 glycogen/starch/alpha-glucan phosphorylase [Thiobacillaceae bacterium]HNI06828.1 glycogen/starch/alpha-glucan phosphorylase [Thiobacillaceae bacterium]